MKKYYLGLDMGTSSDGWAVTDLDYRLIRKKGKDLWGIREFEEADTSAERRAKRTARRNHARSKVRIGYLRDYFHDAVTEADPLFFVRLENSKYHSEDKEEAVRGRNGIFNDLHYTDKDYYKQYPTIFHLRKELLESDRPHDVRLVYLALENMFKHRGHFLNTSLSAEDGQQSLKDNYNFLRQSAEELLDIILPAVDENKLSYILSSHDFSRTLKAEELLLLWGSDKKDKKMVLLAKAVCGLKVDAKALFELETEDKAEFSFSDPSYEEKKDDLLACIGDDNGELIDCMKAVYDAGCLQGILKDADYLSQARVKSYEKHAEDLKILKTVIRQYCGAREYSFMFRGTEEGSYSAYAGSVNAKIKQRRNMKGTGREQFYKTVKRLIDTMPQEDEKVVYIKEQIEKETFMPKQLTADNGIIPNQVHAKEMKKILRNAEGYLPFLKERDESGLTVSERIIALFTFQIPYYVGPTTEKSAKDGGNGWVVRKDESGAVLPWNIAEKIDLKATSEEFMKRLIRKCTYLNGENVLPKGSLEYEAYCVLNEINNIKINDEKISVELKQDIYRELFQKGKKVTVKALEKYMICRGVLSDAAELSGIDKNNINNSLSTYGKFYSIFGDEMNTDKTRHMVEDIVFWCTVYGDSKQFLREQLREHYPELSDELIKKIAGFKFKDWGRLSKEFLEIKGCDKTTGEELSLIRAMWETNYNLMELLHSERFTFAESLNEKTVKQEHRLSEFSEDMLNEYYFSAPVKRMIGQTLKLIREIVEIMGGEPERIFVEMTRKDEEKGDKGRKNSRAKQLQSLYKKIKDESREWVKELEAAEASGKIRSKKMYLYYTQMGRCMYTGEPIELDDLFNDNLYDIDHIYPRHFVKDDSLIHNLVLVKKQKNSSKSDVYPLSAAIRNNPEVQQLWYLLQERNLISKEKYHRLIASKPFSEEQQADFIARQIVETGQGTKGVADLLKLALPDSQIVYVKASNVSDFRKDKKMLKSRVINDMHHAKDAYLNIVVGNVYFVKFTQSPIHFIRNEYKMDPKKNNYNLSRMFDWDVVRGSECAWKASKKGEDGTIQTVKKVMDRNTPLLTRMGFEGHGAIADETLYGKEKAKGVGYIPLKSSDQRLADVTKYGGYGKVSTAYFFLVEHEYKGKRVRTIETVPLFLKEKIAKNPAYLQEYCEKELGLSEPSIRLRKIKIQSLVKLNGYYVYLSGKTGNQLLLRNAVQMCLTTEWMNYVKKVEKAAEDEKALQQISKEKNMELYEILLQKHMNGIYKKKPNPVGAKIQNGKEKFEALEIPKQCQALIQIFNLTAVGTGVGDLSLIGGSSLSGKPRTGKEISKNMEIKLINQSITGIYESSIDLLTV